MVLIIEEKDRVYFATNRYYLGNYYGVSKNDAMLKDNLNIFKMKSPDDCICCVEKVSLQADILRFNRGLITTPLNLASLATKSVPKIKSKLKDYYQVFENDTFEYSMGFASKNKAYVVENSGLVVEVNDFNILGKNSNYAFFKGVMDYYKDLPIEDRIRKAFEENEKITHINAYPIAIIDSINREVKIIEK